MNKNITNYPIDFVIPWVDGNNREWKASKEKYEMRHNSNKRDEVRYRDWENLQYWFRGVEK